MKPRFKSLLKALLLTVLFSLQHLAFSLRAQTTIYLYLTQFTGATNDTVITIQARQNPVIYNGQFYWMPANGTNLITTNGFAQVALIPGQYNVSFASIPQSWTITVTNSATPLNAIGLTTSTLIYSGINSISGSGVTSDHHGNYIISATATNIDNLTGTNLNLTGNMNITGGNAVTNGEDSVTLGDGLAGSDVVSWELPTANPLVSQFDQLLVTTNGWNFLSYPITGNGAGVTNGNVANLAAGNTSSSNNWVGNGAGLTGYLQTNLINDSTVLSVTTNASNWAWYTANTNYTFYPADSGMTNYTLYGTPLPMSVDGNHAVVPAYFIHGYGGTLIAASAESGYGFAVDGTNMQLAMEDKGFQWLLMVDGQIAYVNSQMPSDGNLITYNITFATAARKNVLVFGGWGLVGVVIPSTNSFIQITPTPLAHKTVLYGDSFVAQAYQTNAPLFGLTSQLQYQRMDLDVIGVGVGGSGYVAAGTANGLPGTNFPNHLIDIVTNNPENVIIFGGINDQNVCNSTLLTNIFYVNATNTLLQLKQSLPNANVFVIGPQIPNYPTTPGYTNYLNEAQLLSNACAVAGFSYTDPLAEPWITGSTQAGGTIGNAWQYIQFSDNTHPTIPAGATYFAAQINSAISSKTSPVTPDDIRLVTLSGIFRPIVSSMAPPGTNFFWSSNNGALYWVTSTHTNYVAGP